MASLLNVARFTAVSSGTGDFVVSSAVTGYQTPASAAAVDGAQYHYRAESADLTQWEVGTGNYTAGSTTLARTTVLFNSSGTTSKINFSAAPQVAIVALKEDFAGLPTKYWSGFQHSNNVTTPNTKIDIGAGVARDSTDAFNISTSSGTLDCGTSAAVNGLDAGSLANSTQYYSFAIAKNDGTSGYLASTSPTAPTLPSGYTYYRRIGSFRTDSSAQILAFHHVNDKWYYDTAIRDLNSSAVGTTFANKALSVPAVQGVEAVFAMTFFHATLIITVNMMPAFLPDSAAAGFAYNISSTGGGSFSVRCQVDSSAQVKYKSNQTSSSVVIDTAGWVDPL